MALIRESVHLMRTRKTGAINGSWKRAYNEALCELEVRVRLEKIEIARTALLDEIEVALHAGSCHPHSSEIRTALAVLNKLFSLLPFRLPEALDIVRRNAKLEVIATRKRPEPQ